MKRASLRVVSMSPFSQTTRRPRKANSATSKTLSSAKAASAFTDSGSASPTSIMDRKTATRNSGHWRYGRFHSSAAATAGAGQMMAASVSGREV
jgi:hypothetical protein